MKMTYKEKCRFKRMWGDYISMLYCDDQPQRKNMVRKMQVFIYALHLKYDPSRAGFSHVMLEPASKHRYE